MNVPETDHLKRYMVLSYVIDNPEESIQMAIKDDTEEYLENIISHNHVFLDADTVDIFDDMGTYDMMISESVFDTKREIYKTYNYDKSVYTDLIQYTSQKIRENIDNSIEYLIKYHRTGSLYSVLLLDNTSHNIYDTIRDNEDRLKKVLATLGYMSDFSTHDVSSYSYYHYSETESIRVELNEFNMMTDTKFMFDYVYVDKLDHILNTYDSEIIQKGIEYLKQ